MCEYYKDQYARHVKQWAHIKRETRYWNVWYRGKVTRMFQLKQLKEIKDWKTYLWLKEHWRKELNEKLFE